MRRRGDDGMVTAELAVAIPVVVLVLACCAAGISAGIDQIRCIDGARAAARSAARGDTLEESRRLALRTAPSGATVEVQRDSSEVRVIVTAHAGGLGGWVPGWRVVGEATGPVETSGTAADARGPVGVAPRVAVAPRGKSGS